MVLTSQAGTRATACLEKMGLPLIVRSAEALLKMHIQVSNGTGKGPGQKASRNSRQEHFLKSQVGGDVNGKMH